MLCPSIFLDMYSHVLAIYIYMRTVASDTQISKFWRNKNELAIPQIRCGLPNSNTFWSMMESHKDLHSLRWYTIYSAFSNRCNVARVSNHTRICAVWDDTQYIRHLGIRAMLLMFPNESNMFCVLPYDNISSKVWYLAIPANKSSVYTPV